ncbi:MAG: aminopeptidase, partial [Gammaproteobacteria bacterium]|nr:aminopeptidase [Gammaproteobacteria bacterium]
QLAQLDEGLAFSATRNAEIGRTWFIQLAKRRHTAASEQLEQHVNRYGRGRLIYPVYLALAQNGSELDLAREMLAKARSAYHPLTDARIARALEVGSR